MKDKNRDNGTALSLLITFIITIISLVVFDSLLFFLIGIGVMYLIIIISIYLGRVKENNHTLSLKIRVKDGPIEEGLTVTTREFLKLAGKRRHNRNE